MPTLKVNSKQLQWARKLRNFDLIQAARHARISPKVLQSYEAGYKEITLTDLRKLSKAYALPESTLLLNGPPTLTPDQLKDFRTRTHRGQASVLGPETQIIISRTRAQMRWAVEFMKASPEFGRPRFTSMDRLSNAELEGEAERKRIGYAVEEQLSWSGAPMAFRKWRPLIEQQGIFVFLEKFPLSDCRGISIMDNFLSPAIILNKNETTREVAWIFSLAHEYAHILYGAPGISDRNFENSTEVYCNRFAAGFLLPVELLKLAMGGWPQTARDWSTEEVVELARKTKVSQQAIALRLESLHLAHSGFFQAFKATQSKVPTKKSKGWVMPATKRLFALGRRFPDLVIRAADKNFINKVEATSLLGTKIHTVDAMRSALNL